MLRPRQCRWPVPAWHMLFTRGPPRPGDNFAQLGWKRHRLGCGAARAHGRRLRDPELVGRRQAGPGGGARDGRRGPLSKKQDLVAEVMRLTEDRGVDLV